MQEIFNIYPADIQQLIFLQFLRVIDLWIPVRARRSYSFLTCYLDKYFLNQGVLCCWWSTYIENVYKNFGERWRSREVKGGNFMLGRRVYFGQTTIQEYRTRGSLYVCILCNVCPNQNMMSRWWRFQKISRVLQQRNKSSCFTYIVNRKL